MSCWVALFKRPLRKDPNTGGLIRLSEFHPRGNKTTSSFQQLPPCSLLTCGQFLRENEQPGGESPGTPWRETGSNHQSGHYKRFIVFAGASVKIMKFHQEKKLGRRELSQAMAFLVCLGGHILEDPQYLSGPFWWWPDLHLLPTWWTQLWSPTALFKPVQYVTVTTSLSPTGSWHSHMLWSWADSVTQWHCSLPCA